MMRVLFVRISQIDHLRVAKGAAKEGDASGQIVGRESRRHRNGRDVHQESIECRYALTCHVGWVNSILNQCWLMFDRLVNDRIELVVVLRNPGYEARSSTTLLSQGRSFQDPATCERPRVS